MATKSRTVEPVTRTTGRSPIVAKMDKRRRGPSRNDERRREEFRRAAPARKASQPGKIGRPRKTMVCPTWSRRRPGNAWRFS
jgi:hypothetical protein